MTDDQTRQRFDLETMIGILRREQRKVQNAAQRYEGVTAELGLSPDVANHLWNASQAIDADIDAVRNGAQLAADAIDDARFDAARDELEAAGLSVEALEEGMFRIKMGSGTALSVVSGIDALEDVAARHRI